MASLGGEQQFLSNSQEVETFKRGESRESSVERKVTRDRDEKLKLARERQNEERQRKIEELKAQAEAAQRYREQKEEERRRRIEDIKNRDCEKRQQVEERKRAILEAEKERREYILRKNLERDSKLEVKKKDRNSLVFAFGSSTPRLLEAADFGTVSPSTFWGHRRSTSISNVAGATLSRRSSERELADSGAKKRATSASATERHDGSRSGNVTPGGSISTSRPGSAMSTSTTMSTSGNVPRRSGPGLRKPRPASIAGTVASINEINKLKKDKPPMKNASTPSTSAQNTPRRTSNIMSTSMFVTPSSRLYSAEKRTPAKREQPSTPKATTPKSLSKPSSSERINRIGKDKGSLKTRSSISTPPTSHAEQKNSLATPAKSKDEKNAINCVKTEDTGVADTALQKPDTEVNLIAVVNNEEKLDLGSEKNTNEVVVATSTISRNGNKETSEVRELTPPADGNDLMTASMIAKSKITTEEEAKAALAERRRLARVEAERQAELERQRLEAERLAELKMQEEETERQRLFEEEAIRMAFEQRKAEEERLRLAIEEAKQREDEERRKREDEERQRLEREETDKKAREEAEKTRLEAAERMKQEDKEREERRKRVEAIMIRTRKSGAQSTPNSTPVKDTSEAEKTTPNNDDQIQQQQPTQQQLQHTESASSENSSTSSSTGSTTATTPSPIIAQTAVIAVEPQNTQAMYEKLVIDKESALINSFSNMIIDENVKNLQKHQQQPKIVEVTNGKLHNEFPSGVILQNSTTVANGNGQHVENINNKNERNILQDVVTAADQLIDLSIESHDSSNNAVNFNNNNNNSLLTTTTSTTATLVTADSHENKEISLL